MRFVSVRPLSRALAIFIGSVAWNRSTLLSPPKLDFLFNGQKSSSWAAHVGAKVGANVHSHQAMPGDVQRALRQVNGTPGDMGYVRRLGGADLGAGGRGFESRHPDSFSNMLSIAGSRFGCQQRSPNVGRPWLSVCTRWLPSARRIEELSY